MSSLTVDVVSAENEIYSGEATFVSLPGEQGDLGIYPNHAPLITKIKPGVVTIKKDGSNDETIFVAGGILEVQPRSITVLADTAIRAEDLDEGRLLDAQKKAQEELSKLENTEQIASVENELAVLAAEIATVRKLKKRQI